MKRLIPLIVLLNACVADPTQEELSHADYGPRPTNYEEDLKQIYGAQLRDPYSAVYVFSTPCSGWYKSRAAGVEYGWFETFTVNAKNSYGAFVGERAVTYFYTKGQWELPFLNFDPPRC